MAEIKLTLKHPDRAIEALRYVAQEYLDKQRAEGMVGPGANYPIVQHIADSIEAALPKASVDEPTEWGSAVLAWLDHPSWTAKDRVRWLNDGSCWRAERDTYIALWVDLVDVEVLRVGVGDDAYDRIADLLAAEHRMFGTVDGRLLSDEAELPVGELRRLLWTADADDITPWENDAGSPATPPAEAVEAEAEPQPWYNTPDGEHRLAAWERELLAEPSPEQVEAEPVRAHERDSEVNGYHQTGPDEAHLRTQCDPTLCGWRAPALAEDDPIEALVQEFVAAWLSPGTTKPDPLAPRLRAFAARVLEVGGQQPGVPAIDRDALAIALHDDACPDRTCSPVAMVEYYAKADEVIRILALLPEESTS